MNLLNLTRSAVIAAVLAWLVTFLPSLRTIQAAEAAGAPLPLPRVTETALLAAQAPASACIDRTRIVQDCTLAALPGIRALERQVIADLIAIHELPASAPAPPGTPPPGAVVLDAGGAASNPLAAPQDNASRLLSWERDTLRALLFDKIALIINKEPAAHTDEEKAIVADLAAKVQQQRLTTATEAKRFYELWRSNPCAFKPPTGFTHEPPQSCFIPNALSGIFQNPPSLEQFQAYGAAVAYERFQTDADLQAAAANAAKGYGFLGGVAAAGIAAAAAYSFVTSTALGEALALAISPFGFGGVGGASIGIGIVAAGIAAAAAVIVLAVATLVIAAITVFTAAEIPAKLDAAIAAAQTPPDLAALIAMEAGKRELFGAFLQTTVPPTGSPTIFGGFDRWAPVPAAQPDDQRFLLNPGPSAQPSARLEFKGWDRIGRARLSQGWLVDEAAPRGPALTLHLDYLDHAGERWTAWRTGDRFLHTTPANAKPSFESDLLRYQDAAGVNRTAQILPGSAITGTVTVLPPIGLTGAPVPPTFAAAPPDVTADQASIAGAMVSFPTPAATDANGNAATVSCAPASGDTFPVGATAVTCTATDRFGTTATASFTITVRRFGCNGAVPTIVARPGEVTRGTDGPDVILGTDGPDEIHGGGGGDLICGAGGDDRIYGEGGSDSLYGNEGNDLLDGGDGVDDIYGGAGDDTLLGGESNDWLEDFEGMSQTFDGGGGTLNRCFGLRTVPPSGTDANCQTRTQ